MRGLLRFTFPALLCGALAADAAEPLYTTTANQGGSPGTSWASSVIWSLNGTGAATAAAAGNTYEALFNGVALGSATATTLLRPPYSAGTPNIAVFPGDSLILDTNTQVRLKALSTSGTSPEGLNYESPTNSFPGGNGLIGLVLNGGCLNVGDSGDAATVLGTVQAFPGTLSYIDPADTLTGNSALRGLILAGQLSGSGTIALIDGNVAVPQLITGTSNTFTGGWIVMSGWLQGAGDGTADGYNSLGTNTACTFVVDPNWGAPPIFDASAVLANGPAVLDMGSALANCGGSLILTNGGQLYLHGKVFFGAVTIEGNVLHPGSYTYDTLVGLYPNNFGPSGFPAGSGSLTVQPFAPAPPPPPGITAQPAPQTLYLGATANFSAAGAGKPPLSYQWQKNGSNLTDGGNISGSTNTTLTISNISAADAGNYRMVASNPGGSATSSPALLTVLALTEPYATALVADGPVAFYEFNDTGDPSTNAPAFDDIGGFTGTYGAGVQNGNPANASIAGPGAAQGFPGFAANHKAAQFANATGTSRVTVPPWNLGTNASNVTLTAWLNPNGPQVNYEGVVFCRAGNTVAGMNYSGATDANGNYTLGYTWNNDPATYNWDSRLAPPPGQWSLVALVVTPTNATIYVMNASGLASSVNWLPHVVQAFDGVTLIGDDSNDGGNGARVFNGVIADVAVFDAALSDSQLIALYSAASGVAHFPPFIGGQPLSTNFYAHQTAQLSVAAGGLEPLAYQWMTRPTGSGAFTNLTDTARIAGSTTPLLNLANLATADAGDYRVVISNAFGVVTSSVATLTVTPTQPAQNITMTDQEAIGEDWDTAIHWSDGNPASVSAVTEFGSTYELLPGSRMRSPATTQDSVFPGNVLTVDGDGVFVNGGGGTVAEIRFKQPASGSSVTFKKLVMNGGQFDLGNAGVLIIRGEIDILTNTPMYVDTGGTSGRDYQIDAWLTGSGSIEFYAFDNSLTSYLEVTGASNTFSGAWNIDQGLLLGTGPDSLGTNSITIATNGTLETTYDISNTNATLTLYGQMLLHQNDTFGKVVIDGTPLTNGLYTFAQLTNLYPAHFPATWTPAAPVPNFSSGSGSLNVGNVALAPPAKVMVSIQRAPGGALQVSWPQGLLLEANQLIGPWQTNTAASPYLLTPTAPQKFYRVIVR